MTAKMSIVCPKCNHEFSLTETAEKEMEVEYARRLKHDLEVEKTRILQQVKKEASKEADEIILSRNNEISDLRRSLVEKEDILRETQKAEMELRRRGRELEEKAKSLELEVERKLDSERALIVERTKNEERRASEMRDAEKDKKIADALKQVEDLKRKMEQGSQQTQGEVFELKVEEFIRQLFPHDRIEEVAKGIKGGDITQTVITKAGMECGKILWELKRTKSFSDGWIAKLKNDGRAANADILLLVSEVIPEAYASGFGELDGVWVSTPENAMALAAVLRKGLFMAARERSTKDGIKTKAEAVYAYLTSNNFRGRVEAVVDAFKGIKEDLDTEKRNMERLWAKREMKLGQALTALAGMHGDLEGLAEGLPQVKSLTMES